MELKVDRGIVDSCSVLNRFLVIVKLAYGHFVCKKALELSSFHSQEPKYVRLSHVCRCLKLPSRAVVHSSHFPHRRHDLHLGYSRVSGEEQPRLQGHGPARADVLLRRHRRVQARLGGVRQPLQGRAVVPRSPAHGVRRAQHQVRARVVLRGAHEHRALGGRHHHGTISQIHNFTGLLWNYTLFPRSSSTSL